jgi:hypothetical protein
MTSSIALVERLTARNQNEDRGPRVNAGLKVEPMSTKRAHGAQAIFQGESGYPDRLIRRLGTDAPKTIKIVGPSAPLSLPLTAFLCSKETPGATILKAFDQAAAWRDTGQCVISGFHSPLEQQILDILLRGKQPIVMALARSVGALRMPAAQRDALNDGRLTIISPFTGCEKRVTADLAHHRNRFVAALADEVIFAFISPGGRLSRVAEEVTAWGTKCGLLHH